MCFINDYMNKLNFVHLSSVNGLYKFQVYLIITYYFILKFIKQNMRTNKIR